LKDKHYSANFKKDYLAYFAITLFFVIVGIELYVAIWLPVYLKSQDKWAIQENRQEMLDRFDGTRRQYSKLKHVTREGKDEVAMIMNCLNNNAIYLRAHQMDLSIDQINALTSDYKAIAGFLKILKLKSKDSGKYESSLGQKRQLKTEIFLETLRKKSAARFKEQVQQYNKNGYIE
jgi:hypothetical protein